jgi:uncharacterized Zn-finger protein
MVVMTNTNNGLAREAVKMFKVDDFQQKNVSCIMIKKDNLPVHCPPKDARKWNMHPKVYLQFNEQGRAVCPYCGSKYELD